jgi:hypothetical protein
MAVAVGAIVGHAGGWGIARSSASRGDLAVLVKFRQGFYECLTRWADAAFELADALLCWPGPVSSVPALSLEPVFCRGWGSLYAALAHYLAVYGRERPAETQVRTAVGARFMVRMGSPSPFRRLQLRTTVSRCFRVDPRPNQPMESTWPCSR